MKKSIDVEIKQAIEDGAVEVTDNCFRAADGTKLKIRSMESTYDPLEEGDEFTIPNDFKVLSIKFNKDDKDEPLHPFIYVEVKSKDGSERNFRFFPNSLCKTCNPVVDGKRQAKVKTTGSASELYRSAATSDVDDGLALLRGKTIRVTSAKIYTIQDWRTHLERGTHIYQYDLVLVY